jgi:hypothetical protein
MISKAASAPNTPTQQPRRQIPREEIACRAERLWHERNCPADADDAIWLEAESQLQAEAEAQPVSGTDSRPYADEPGTPLRTNTKSRDPAEAAAQTRSAQPPRPRAPGSARRQRGEASPAAGAAHSP